MNAQKKLAEIETKLTEIGARDRDLSTRHAAARRRVEELQAELELAFEQGAIGLDGSPSDDQIRKLHAALAKAKADADPELFARHHNGLDRARRKLESEREQIATQHFDDLAAELVARGDDIRADFDGLLNAVAPVAQRWQELEQAWLALERATGRSASPSTRLDIPKFPLDVTGDLDARPIPFTLVEAAESVAIPTA